MRPPRPLQEASRSDFWWILGWFWTDFFYVFWWILIDCWLMYEWRLSTHDSLVGDLIITSIFLFRCQNAISSQQRIVTNRELWPLHQKREEVTNDAWMNAEWRMMNADWSLVNAEWWALCIYIYIHCVYKYIYIYILVYIYIPRRCSIALLHRTYMDRPPNCELGAVTSKKIRVNRSPWQQRTLSALLPRKRQDWTVLHINK